MATKYKISEGMLKNLFGIFGKKEKPKDVAKMIDNDPRLKALDRQIGDLNRQAAQRIKSTPDFYNLLKKAGIEITE
jgi:hypothetical protein